MLGNIYDRINDYGSVKISLASPNDIRSWSFGEVRKPETINYRTYRPEKDGLFCERIFGPERDWECACGKYKGTKFKGIICDRCGVKVTHSRERRRRMGHINLAAPVGHIWFFKSMPSRMGNLLAVKVSSLEKVIYFQEYVVVEPGGAAAEGIQEKQLIGEDEYQRLLRACSHNPRDAAVIEVLLQTGMRLSELARLTIYDVEIPKRINREPDNTGTVRVKRKGGKVDTIPLNYKACQALAAWLKLRPEVDFATLFVTKFNTPMSKRGIQYTVSKYLQAADIKNASVHTLRHTMATHHIARGTDLKTIQATLGHASLETTARYISLAKTTQRKALQEHAL